MYLYIYIYIFLLYTYVNIYIYMHISFYCTYAIYALRISTRSGTLCCPFIFRIITSLGGLEFRIRIWLFNFGLAVERVFSFSLFFPDDGGDAVKDAHRPCNGKPSMCRKMCRQHGRGSYQLLEKHQLELAPGCRSQSRSMLRRAMTAISKILQYEERGLVSVTFCVLIG